MKDFTETPSQQKIRMNLTMEAVNYFNDKADPYTADYGDIRKNLGEWLEKIQGTLTLMVVWALVNAGCCILFTTIAIIYFMCCKKKDEPTTMSEEIADDQKIELPDRS